MQNLFGEQEVYHGVENTTNEYKTGPKAFRYTYQGFKIITLGFGALFILADIPMSLVGDTLTLPITIATTDYRERGNQYYQDGEYRKAINDYKVIVADNPDLEDDIARSYMYLGEYDTAMEWANRANVTGVYTELATFLIEADRFEDALQMTKNGLAADSYRKIAEAFRKAGQYDHAINMASKGLDRDEKHKKLWFTRGNIFIEKGAYQRAIEDFDEAIFIDEEYRQAYKKRAMAHKELGNDEKYRMDMQISRDLIHKQKKRQATEEARQERLRLKQKRMRMQKKAMKKRQEARDIKTDSGSATGYGETKSAAYDGAAESAELDCDYNETVKITNSVYGREDTDADDEVEWTATVSYKCIQ